MNDQRKQRILEDMIVDWAVRKIAEFKNGIQNKKLVASGNLRDSLQYKLNVRAATLSFTVFIQYAYYGRFFIDGHKPNRLNSGRGRSINRYIYGLMDWMRAKGADKFISRYMRKYDLGDVSRNRILNKVAWGIARKRSRRSSKIRKNWFGKQSRHEDQLINQAGEVIGTIFIQSMQGEFNQQNRR